MDIEKWSDLQPGDTVIEHDGHHSVFVIARAGTMSHPHWDVVVLSSDHPRNGELTAYRSNWIRCSGDHVNGPRIPPMHEVIRAGVTVLFPHGQGKV